jgi:hypothetical protein
VGHLNLSSSKITNLFDFGSRLTNNGATLRRSHCYAYLERSIVARTGNVCQQIPQFATNQTKRLKYEFYGPTYEEDVLKAFSIGELNVSSSLLSQLVDQHAVETKQECDFVSRQYDPQVDGVSLVGLLCCLRLCSIGEDVGGGRLLLS